MSNKVVFLNRSFVPEDRAAFSVFDRGLLYGDGLFETVRIYNGKFFRLAAHIKRLFSGLKFLGIQIPYSKAEMEIFTREVALSNEITDGFARIVVSRGEGFLGFSPRGSATPHVAICARERKVDLQRRDVWKLMPHERAIAPLPIKSLSYLPHVLAKKDAEENGFDEAILFGTDGKVIEATSSNIFLCKGDRFLTPPLTSGCLPGITRSEVIKVAKKKGFKVEEKNFGMDECRKAEGFFLTNSLLEIVPAHLKGKISRDLTSTLDELEAEFAYYRTTQAK
jgi:branched-chain amino acid aminotransferase